MSDNASRTDRARRDRPLRRDVVQTRRDTSVRARFAVVEINKKTGARAGKLVARTEISEFYRFEFDATESLRLEKLAVCYNRPIRYVSELAYRVSNS